MILFWGPDYIWEVYFHPKIELREKLSEYVYPATPPPRGLSPLLRCPSPSGCAPLPEGRHVCRPARWHDPPENVLAPMSAQECGGWSERKRAKLTGYNGRRKKGLATGKRNLTTSISVFEWPILHTIQLFFMRSKCSRVTTFLFPKSKTE